MTAFGSQGRGLERSLQSFRGEPLGRASAGAATCWRSCAMGLECGLSTTGHCSRGALLLLHVWAPPMPDLEQASVAVYPNRDWRCAFYCMPAVSEPAGLLYPKDMSTYLQCLLIGQMRCLTSHSCAWCPYPDRAELLGCVCERLAAPPFMDSVLHGPFGQTGQLTLWLGCFSDHCTLQAFGRGQHLWRCALGVPK